MGKSDPIKTVDPALAKLGFTRIRPGRKMRISAEASGKTKSGKTRLVLKMPQPIGILNTDRSLEDLLNNEEFSSVDVVVKDFSDKFTPGEQLTQNAARALEADFSNAYRALLGHKLMRSVAIDKWTTLWEVARFAEFGVASVKAHHYVPVNLRMRGYLSIFQQHDKNLLVTEDLKEEWVGDKSTGRWIIDGFKYTPGLVQTNISMWRDSPESGDLGFRMRIDGCALNADLVGWEFSNDDITWAKMATMVMPETTMKDWR